MNRGPFGKRARVELDLGIGVLERHHAADVLAEMLEAPRVTVNAKRRSGRSPGLEGAKRGFGFPVWQLNTERKPYRVLAALMERLGALWAVYRFPVHR